MAHARIQVQHTCDVFGIFHLEIEHVIKPILAEAIPILHCDRDRIFLAAEQAIQFKLDFNFIACVEITQFGALQRECLFRRCPCRCDSESVCRPRGSIRAFETLRGFEERWNLRAGKRDRFRRSSSVFERPSRGWRRRRAENSSSWYRASSQRFFQQAAVSFLAGALAVEHKTHVAIDRILRRALHDDSSIQHERRAIGQTLDQTQIVRYQQHGDVLFGEALRTFARSGWRKSRRRRRALRRRSGPRDRRESRWKTPGEHTFRWSTPLTGRSMNCPISAKPSMRGNASSNSSRDNPMISPFRYTFSRPLNSGLKPAPSSSKAATRPEQSTRPLVG